MAGAVARPLATLTPPSRSCAEARGPAWADRVREKLTDQTWTTSRRGDADADPIRFAAAAPTAPLAGAGELRQLHRMHILALVRTVS